MNRFITTIRLECDYNADLFECQKLLVEAGASLKHKPVEVKYVGERSHHKLLNLTLDTDAPNQFAAAEIGAFSAKELEALLSGKPLSIESFDTVASTYEPPPSTPNQAVE